MHNNPCIFYVCIFVFSLLFTTNSQWFVFSMLTSFSNKHINAQCMQILGLNNAITCIFINTEYCSVCSCICLFSLHRGRGQQWTGCHSGFCRRSQDMAISSDGERLHLPRISWGKVLYFPHTRLLEENAMRWLCSRGHEENLRANDSPICLSIFHLFVF